MLTQERLKQLLQYDPATGVFTWLVSTVRARAGDVAGSVKRDSGHGDGGYRLIVADRMRYRAHRLAWLYVTGKWPEHDIDHKNGRRDDNAWSNLREAPSGGNHQNMRAHRDNGTGVLGVSWDKSRKRYMAQIQVDRKHKTLGRFGTIAEAEAAYIAAKANLHSFNPVPRGA